jgi:putative ABC transport system ATP-binding protein
LQPINAIQLQSILPEYLDAEKTSTSDIWNKHVVFKKGEIVHISAPSGTGKTTFIHALYGLVANYKNNILLNDTELKGTTPEELAGIRASGISIVFQDLRLFKDKTALENIEIKRKLSPYHQTAQIESMAEKLGIGDKLHQTAGTCSYGEQQRIAIIRALQQPYDFILLDEPFSHLDNDNAQKAWDLIKTESEKRGAGILLADLEQLSFVQSNSKMYL